MPWWLLGFSMVATTFSADTPNLVTDIVRQNGVSGNWQWWAFLLTGMLTVFVYARLWRRSGVLTDLEFYELRYSGKEAAFLRAFRSVYLGLLFNIVIMATVCLAAIKIGSVLLGFSPAQTLIVASVVTVIYSSIGGLKGVILTDFFQFIIAMVGSIGACIVVLNLPEIGGVQGMMQHSEVLERMSFFPDFSNPKVYIPLFLIPLAVQWWSVWYPGAEPGGGGYIVQRMLSAKDEKHAFKATLFFNVAHYALRPWPWILIGLASLVIYPMTPDPTAIAGSLEARGLASLAAAFPDLPADKIGHDLAYPAMLRFLPVGLMGLVVASLIAAFMSTLSTHLNWGASYLVNDLYVRFIKPEASQKEQVNAGRIVTVLLMALAALLALTMQNALDAFNIILQIGAGTGLIFILRWFWWRISAYTEIAGMIISFVVALAFHFLKPGWAAEFQLLLSVAITTFGWLLVTFLTPATDTETLQKFYKLIKPWGRSWLQFSNGEKVGTDSNALPFQILAMLLGCIAVYSALFATGSFLYQDYSNAWILTAITAISTLAIGLLWKKISGKN
jgi:Na+/proline symporter